MKRGKIIILLLLLYFLFVVFELPLVFKSGTPESEHFMHLETLSLSRPSYLQRRLIGNERRSRATLSSKHVSAVKRSRNPKEVLSRLQFNETVFHPVANGGEVVLLKAAKQAWFSGRIMWEELNEQTSGANLVTNSTNIAAASRCPDSIVVSGSEFESRNRVVELPCGMTLGTSVTVVGSPRWPHSDKEPMISTLKIGEAAVMVSQFFMELQGLKSVDGEDPPRILHFNPRLIGDWSGKPVIELNTCYRMQWGSPVRCEGWGSPTDEETVDGQVKCEKWLNDDIGGEGTSRAMWWLKRLIGRKQKASYTWPFPFSEGKLFVLSVRAGMEGYHLYVDGRHIASFPYRIGFALEDATGVTLNGDVDVRSVFATNLPAEHPNFAPQLHLEYSPKWQAPPLPNQKIDLFIGILSSGNHFAERMAIRKAWMQHPLIKSSAVVARFFVAMAARKVINIELKKEAEYFGDIVVVPYVDHYDLVVMKTVAICEFGARQADANYVMKCDDDTFVRVDAVISEAKKAADKSLYMGNINYNHSPLRSGKWAVTYEEWPKDEYPPYADGPGYVISHDIAEFVVAEFEKQTLGLFKMEDVSMGTWVQKFNRTRTVGYVHSARFCQHGCEDGYLTAHYQSPRQMVCLWDKLLGGGAQCCNGR